MVRDSQVLEVSGPERYQVGEQIMVHEISSLLVAPRHALITRAVEWMVRLIFYGLRGDPLDGVSESTTGERNT